MRSETKRRIEEQRCATPCAQMTGDSLAGSGSRCAWLMMDLTASVLSGTLVTREGLGAKRKKCLEKMRGLAGGRGRCAELSDSAGAAASCCGGWRGALPRPRGLADVPPCSNRGGEAKRWATFIQRQFEMKLRVQSRSVGSSCRLGFKLGFCEEKLGDGAAAARELTCAACCKCLWCGRRVRRVSGMKHDACEGVRLEVREVE